MGLDRRERPRGWGEGGTGCSPLSTAAPPPRAPIASGSGGTPPHTQASESWATVPACHLPSPSIFRIHLLP